MTVWYTIMEWCRSIWILKCVCWAGVAPASNNLVHFSWGGHFRFMNEICVQAHSLSKVLMISKTKQSCMQAEDRSSGAAVFITAFYAWAAITWNCSHDIGQLLIHIANVFNLLTSPTGRKTILKNWIFFSKCLKKDWSSCWYDLDV